MSHTAVIVLVTQLGKGHNEEVTIERCSSHETQHSGEHRHGSIITIILFLFNAKDPHHKKILEVVPRQYCVMKQV